MTLAVDFSKEVADAIEAGQPVVALESTIITHGMPYPQNLEMAENVQAIVREIGATPATIAIIDGQIKIGLAAEDLKKLARTESALKLSRADIGACIAQGNTGATTVAATMILAAHSGISVFATGGIGGVHRGADLSFDISADLHELAKTPVTVVAAGAKAILDIPKTLEVLETLGVPVIGYCTEIFPAFWSRKSKCTAPITMNNPGEVARAHQAQRDLGLMAGQLVANPVPKEHEIPRDEMEPIITAAVKKANAQGVSGKALTPFLLAEILQATSGRSLATNIALVQSNAALAAEIAVALNQLTQS